MRLKRLLKRRFISRNINFFQKIPSSGLKIICQFVKVDQNVHKQSAVSNKIASRRLQLAGHCYRHPELGTQKLVLWKPTHGHRGRGRPNTTYVDTLKRDIGAFEASEIAVLMADKRLWKDLVVARLRATK